MSYKLRKTIKKTINILDGGADGIITTAESKMPI
jgi:hypothetical protein